MKQARRYEPRNPLQAIDPKAFLGLFVESEPPVNDEREDYTVVTVRGPLTQYDDWWEDSYEAICNRVEQACAQPAPVVILRIDSPGGDVAGLFDAARTIRETCQRAGKELVAHVEGQCCSAAYALATAADRIVASKSAEVGSIGVIAARVDESRALEDAGIKVSLITSGERKGDGWPVRPMSEDELEAFQADINSLAQEFFDLVSERRDIPSDEIAAYQAACFRGDAARTAKLIDGFGSFNSMVASLGAAPARKNMDEIKEALRAIAEDEECAEEEREQARRALAAMEGEEEESAEGESEEEEAEGEEDEPEAEDGEDDESAEDEEDDKEAKARSFGSVSAKTASALAAISAKTERRLARIEKRYEAEDRKRLIAAHGGVTPKLAKVLASKPLSEVKAILAGVPQPKKPKLGDHAATTTVGGTRGKDQGKASQLPPDESKAMRRAMGLQKTKLGVKVEGDRQILGAVIDDEEVR